MKEKVSVIIPTYNRAKTIKNAINSVLRQTYTNLEVIIVDDGSTDNTSEVVKKINDKRIKYYRYEKNKGACYARNYGIKKSSGSYITFNDSDDIYKNKKIEMQYNKIKSTNSDFCFCKLIIHTMNNEVVVPSEDQEASILDNKVFDKILEGNFISTQTIFCKREVLLDNMFDDELPRFQDYDLVLRLLKKYKTTYVNEVLVDLYRQDDSISGSYEKLLNAIRIMMQKDYGFDKNNRNKLNEFLLKAYTNQLLEDKYLQKLQYEEIIKEQKDKLDEKEQEIISIRDRCNNLELQNKDLKNYSEMITNSKTWRIRSKIVKLFKK